MYFITIKRMLEVCFSAHPNIQYRAAFFCLKDENDGWNDRTIRGTAAANMKKEKCLREVSLTFFSYVIN